MPHFCLCGTPGSNERLAPQANQDWIDDGKLGRLDSEESERIRQRLKERLAQVPGERKLVDELIAERRMEGRRDGAE